MQTFERGDMPDTWTRGKEEVETNCEDGATTRGGVVRRTVEGRETFYTCDLVPGRGGRMRQTSLTFSDATVDARVGLITTHLGTTLTLILMPMMGGELLCRMGWNYF